MLYKFFIKYKDTALQQHWIGVIKKHLIINLIIIGVPPLFYTSIIYGGVTHLLRQHVQKFSI